MKIKVLWSKKWFRTAVCTFCAVLILIIGVCAYVGIHSPLDLIAFYQMSRECDPIWKDLALRRVYQGQSIDNLMEIRRPAKSEQVGPYQRFAYTPGPYTALSVYAKEGRLVFAKAAGCTWEHLFFGTAEEEEKILAAYQEQRAKDKSK